MPQRQPDPFRRYRHQQGPSRYRRRHLRSSLPPGLQPGGLQLHHAGGDFAIILIVSHEKPFTRARLSDEFRSHFDRTGLHVHVRTLHEDEVCPVKEEGELCLVSVYGSDQPGIVYRVTRELADRQVNITDLNTRLIGTKEEPVYVLMLEAILPPGMSVENVELLLEKLKKELNVEIKVRVITPVSL